MIDLVKNKTGRPLISIIIPIYNVENYIERCIWSVLNQTMKRFELILVDDCSSDNSIEIAENLINKYKGNDIDIYVYHHKENIGLSASRNTGIKHAKGDYVFFLDSDDFLTQECVCSFLKILEKYPDVDIVQGNTDSNVVSVKKAVGIDGRRLPEYTENHNWIEKGLLNSKIIPVTAWNKLIRRDLILQYQLFFYEGIIHEDVLWCFFLSKVVHTYAVNRYITYIYWQRENSIMTSCKVKEEFHSCFFIIKTMFENITTQNLCFQKRKIMSIYLNKLERESLYENRYQREMVLTYIKNKSTFIGRQMIIFWDKFPSLLKKNRYIIATIKLLYGYVG